MNQHLPSFISSKLRKYSRLKRKIAKQIAARSFYKLTAKKRFYLLNKLKKLALALSSLRPQLKVAVASGLMLSMAHLANAQEPFGLRPANNPFPKALNAGINSKPVMFDVNNDGDIDLFSGSNDGKIHFYENTGTGPLVERTGSANPLNAFSSSYITDITFENIDGDADKDAILINDDGIKVYKNNGSGVFTSEPIANTPFSGISTTDDYIAFADTDKDLDNDLIISNDGGNIRYFQNNAGAYTELTGTNNPFNGVLNSDNQDLAFADLDTDGDLDAFVGFKGGNLGYYQNDNNVFSAQTNTFFTGMNTGSYFSPTFGDFNGDGKVDAILGEEDGYFRYFENDGSNELVLVDKFDSKVGGGFYHEAANAASYYDADNDGDVDAFIIQGLWTIYAENDGAGNFTEESMPFNNLNIYNVNSYNFFDFDGDTDVDVFIGESSGIGYYENDGSGTLTAPATNPMAGVTSGGGPVTFVKFFNLDGDSDMDAFVPQFGGGIKYYENNGAGALTEKTGTNNPVDEITNTGIVSIDFLDTDEDNDIDLFMSMADGTIKLFLNDGSNGFTEAAATDNPFNGVIIASASIGFADTDDDGDTDAIIGGSSFTFYESNPSPLAGVSKNAAAISFNIFPNPTNSQVTIAGNFSDEITYEVIDSRGVLQLNGKGKYFSADNLQPGIYMIRITDAGKSGMKQLIVY
ncbi:MAG: T9SS type A sorting domain-containing protein [Cytophagaceae bacterium]|nr:T9SS type A sorting domain-containing protein [Cytophagaceae bacterium]